MFEKLGRFEIKGLLGRGAMGEVYLGLDPALGRAVAVKTIHAAAAQGEDAKRRFAWEAKAAGVLNHPNIVTIYEFGEDQGVLFIAMERVRGQDLEELFRQRSLTPGEALEVLAQVCDGLEFAHRNHVIHRDIKPSNVRVLRDGRRTQAKVMDFGVARLKDSELTATGTVVGTVGALAGGGFLFSKRMTAQQPVRAAVQEPPKESPAKPTPGPHNPEDTSGVKPLAATLSVPRPLVQPQAKPQSQTKLPPPVLTENAEPKPVQSDVEPPGPSGLPSQEQKNRANLSLSEAIRWADSDPKRAIEGLRRAVAADPQNTNAYAWLAVLLYEQGRYQEIPVVIALARQQGIPRARLMSNMRFKMVMQNDRLNHRIPGGIGGDE